MKRIVVGLMILGLVIGGFLSCVLNGPADAVDQTQVDSVLATLSADGAFGQAIGRTIVTGEVVDGWEYADSGALGEATIESLIFATDGTWEYKLMEYEAAAKTSTVHADQAADADANGNGVLSEGWVQTVGNKGTYSYNADTKVLTINYAGINFVTGTTPAYAVAWNGTTNNIVGGEQLMASKPIVFKTFTFDADGNSNLITAAELAAFVVNENTICETLLGLFTYGAAADGYKYFAPDYATVKKNYANNDLAAPIYTVVTTTETMTVSDTEITYQNTQVTMTDNFTGTDTYVGADDSNDVYTVSLNRPLADGYMTMLDGNAIMVKSYVLTFVAASGTFTKATTPTFSSAANAKINAMYDHFQMFGDGFIAY